MKRARATSTSLFYTALIRTAFDKISYILTLMEDGDVWAQCLEPLILPVQKRIQKFNLDMMLSDIQLLNHKTSKNNFLARCLPDV